MESRAFLYGTQINADFQDNLIMHSRLDSISCAFFDLLVTKFSSSSNKKKEEGVKEWSD
jgi:hypothetical protein